MEGFVESIRNGRRGLVLGNSIYLPFRLDLLSVWIGKEMSMLATPELMVDLCPGNGDVAIREEPGWTNIVFRRYRDLAREFGGGRGHVVLYAAEKGGDLFAPDQRHYIRISFDRDGKDASFEIIDDPFML